MTMREISLKFRSTTKKKNRNDTIVSGPREHENNRNNGIIITAIIGIMKET